MRTPAAIAAVALLLAASPALAQHAGHEGHAMPEHPMPEHSEPEQQAQPATRPASPPAHDPHAHHRMHTDQPAQADAEAPVPAAPPPPAATAGPEHAADTLFPPGEMARARHAMHAEMGGMAHHLVTIDRLELQSGAGTDAILWDANAWIGGDIDKLWLKTEGEVEWSGPVEEAEVQALWSHALGQWFDLQAGVRYDLRPRPGRAHLVLGLQGLAPYFFELDAAAFLSEKGDLTARIEAEYDQRITQRLIAQPRIELNLSAQDVPELGLGSGFTSLQAGLRLRYEVVREFAPYIGVEWQRDFGDTADFRRAAGGDPDRVVFVVGVRAWF
jgi:copper resistance protein B